MKRLGIKLFAGSKVNNFEVTIFGNHDVLWFEVSVNYHVRVYSFKHMNYDGCVKSGLLQV
jgi:hypothetical protein